MQFGHFLTDKLMAISGELNQLNHYSEDFYQHYQSNTFENHQALTDKLDNLIHATTHEIATMLGFQTQDIVLMINFIEFRQRFSEFNSTELEQIIDNVELSASQKLTLAKMTTNGNHKMLLEKIRLIKSHWFANFDKSYQQISEKFNKP